jgi:hypothetical protein
VAEKKVGFIKMISGAGSSGISVIIREEEFLMKILGRLKDGRQW